VSHSQPKASKGSYAVTRQTTFEEFEAVEVQGEEARIFHQTKINRRAYTEKHQGTPEATFFAITAPSVVQITKRSVPGNSCTTACSTSFGSANW
jgi:hypothetical protein